MPFFQWHVLLIWLYNFLHPTTAVSKGIMPTKAIHNPQCLSVFVKFSYSWIFICTTPLALATKELFNWISA